jgi:hypothetical protein
MRMNGMDINNQNRALSGSIYLHELRFAYPGIVR